MYSGVPPPVKLVLPRMVILVLPLGPVPVPATLTPAIWPLKALARFAVRDSVRLDPGISVVEYPSDFICLFIPNAVTTTSLNSLDSSLRLTFISDRLSMSISWVIKPTNENTSVPLAGASIV